MFRVHSRYNDILCEPSTKLWHDRNGGSETRLAISVAQYRRGKLLLWQTVSRITSLFADNLPYPPILHIVVTCVKRIPHFFNIYVLLFMRGYIISIKRHSHYKLIANYGTTLIR